MAGLRFVAITIIVCLSVAKLSVADTPNWISSAPSSDSLVKLSLPDESDSPAHQQLRPDAIFSVSSESLIRVSCSEASAECGDGVDCFAQTDCGRTWVQFTPYAWATQIKGDLTVDGLTAPLNIDLGDLWQLAKNGEVRGAFMGHLEFGRDNWSLFVNGDIVSMDPSAQIRRANIETGMSMTLLELGGAVDLFNANESDPVNSPLRVQMLGGVRYYAVDASAILSLPNINPVVEVSSSEQWVDLFVGSRVVGQLAPGVKGFVRGDVGGFGIGTSSNFAWNLVTGVSTECVCGSNLLLGYRLFDVNQSLNGGTGAPQGFGVDALIHGPVIGLSFQF